MSTAVLLVAPGFAMPVRAQPVEGVLVDKNRSPLSGATLFLDQTSQGTLTDAHGRFSLTAPQAGAYTLIASYLGCQPLSLSLLLARNQSLTLDTLVMLEAVIPLREVVVEALDPEKQCWYLRIFERDLLGRSTVARQGCLLNPEVLSFLPVEGGFRAEAAAPIVVENPATGYRIQVLLERYEHHRALI